MKFFKKGCTLQIFSKKNVILGCKVILYNENSDISYENLGGKKLKRLYWKILFLVKNSAFCDEKI